MRDGVADFKDYILSKKFRLLHYLCERLYSFAEYSNVAQNSEYRVTLDDVTDCFMLEVRGSEMLSVDERLKIHSKLYKRLKPCNVKLGRNGQQLLFEQLEELYELA